MVVVIGKRERRAGVGGAGGGNEAPAPNDYGQGRGVGSGRPAAPSGTDTQRVKDCAADSENIFSEAESKGAVIVTHRNQIAYSSEGGIVAGRANWHGSSGSVHIEIYPRSIERIVGQRNGDAYWREYAITLLHEYRHAVDMFACQCNNPGKPPLSPEGYESATEQAAQDDYSRLYAGNESCLAR